MKKNIIFSLILLLSGVVQAQEKGHYLFFNAGGGLHNLSYKVTDGTVKTGLGFTGNLGYNYFFTPNFGIGTGLGVQSYKSVATLNFMSSNAAIDADGDAYDYRIYYSNWQETQNLLSLDIPLAFSYQTSLGIKSGLLFSVGAKVSIPLNSTYKTTAGQIDTRGYYQQWNVELSGMPQHNFNTLTTFPSSNFTAKTIYSVSADFGYLHKLSDNLNLYLGAYVNYGLNNIITPGTKLVYQQDGVYNGVISSNQTSKANLISVGLKIGITLHLPSKNKVVPNDVIITNIDTAKTVVNTDTTKVIPNNNVVNIDTIPVTPIDTVKNVVINEDEQPLANAKRISNEIKFNYNKNSDVPLNIQVDEMKDLAQLLIQNPNMKILIVGHTSLEGTKEVNIRIGLERAEKVKSLLMSYGVPESQITTDTKYYLEPLVPNTTEANRAKNRRVEIFIK